MDIARVGVVGAGVMGRGVAQNLAQAGIRVVLVDVAQDVLEAAKTQISRDARLQSMLGGPKSAVAPDDVLKAIRTSTDPGELAGVEYVIENVTEDWETKAKVYTTLHEICTGGCIFAANTSAIPITRIAEASGRRDRVIGVHFMNPVPVTDTVELILTEHTSERTRFVTGNLLRRMGKGSVTVKDGPGFVSNRVLMVTINEAVRVVQEGLAEPAAVDRLFRQCFGHKMGPLETADLIGLDTIVQTLKVLHDSYGDEKYVPADLLNRMVAEGRAGRKSGRGFHGYGSEVPRREEA